MFPLYRLLLIVFTAGLMGATVVTAHLSYTLGDTQKFTTDLILLGVQLLALVFQLLVIK